jgi:murein DD-endopeptidase
LKWLGTWLLVATLLGGCAPKRVFRQPDLVEERPPPSAPRPAGTPTAALQKGLEVANLAQAQLGRPYRWGGNLPQRGFDCSGLVQWTYQSVGVDLPRVVREQVRVGRSVDPQRLHPGDLVFFNLTGDRASHVGIYVGEGRFVHAPRTGQPVRTDELSDPYWRQRWSATRRILDP